MRRVWYTYPYPCVWYVGMCAVCVWYMSVMYVCVYVCVYFCVWFMSVMYIYMCGVWICVCVHVCVWAVSVIYMCVWFPAGSTQEYVDGLSQSSWNWNQSAGPCSSSSQLCDLHQSASSLGLCFFMKKKQGLGNPQSGDKNHVRSLQVCRFLSLA